MGGSVGGEKGADGLVDGGGAGAGPVPGPGPAAEVARGAVRAGGDFAFEAASVWRFEETEAVRLVIRPGAAPGEARGHADAVARASSILEGAGVGGDGFGAAAEDHDAMAVWLSVTSLAGVAGVDLWPAQ